MIDKINDEYFMAKIDKCYEDITYYSSKLVNPYCELVQVASITADMRDIEKHFDSYPFKEDILERVNSMLAEYLEKEILFNISLRTNKS